MAERKTRGRRSKVQRIPKEIKAALDSLLRDGRHTQKEILNKINELLEGAGEETLSRSGFNRYSTRMETVGQRIREAREVADVWTAKLGTQPTTEVSQILIEMVRTLAFDMTLKSAEDPEMMTPKFISQLALGIQRLETAADKSTKREAEIRKAVAIETAEVTEKVMTKQGVSRETIDQIKRDILGISND